MSEDTPVPTFCCAMRKKFLIGIISQNPNIQDPPDVLDFIDWDSKGQTGRPVIRIKFCPFCGSQDIGNTTTTETHFPKEPKEPWQEGYDEEAHGS